MFRKRLKNVYELLESGNNKKVVQEVDKLLMAKPTGDAAANEEKLSILTIARALKSLALLRLGKQDEAECLVNELLDANTRDENALNIVMQYCKETQQLGKIVLFYENAVKNSTSGFDEDMFTSLFYAYVRNRDYAKQQQCAIKLYKETSKRVYLCWNAMSYFLMHKYQTPTTESNKVNKMNLQLAEKLLEKQYKERKLESGGEYQLYLLILETRGDLRTALKILDQSDLDLDSKLGMYNYTLEKRIEYVRKLEEWPELRSLCESKLEESLLVDNWKLYLAYIESLEKTASDLNEAEVDKIIERFNSIRKKREGEKIQGPYLAKIELTARRKMVDKCKLYLREYVETFACKPGFVYDVIYFSQTIREFNLVEFVLNDVLKPLYDKARQQPFKSIKSIYTCLSYFEFKRRFGASDGGGGLEESRLLETLYKNALSTFGADMLPTAYQYADEFLILAVYNRLESEPNTDELVLGLISNLKCALGPSPSNHHLKLLLINLYSHLGAYDALQNVYDSMEVKNIQNYSISYLMLSQILRLSAGSSYSVVSSSYQFFTSNLFDVANFLVNCYKYGTFLKLVEFIEFMQTVRDSFGYALSLATFAVSAHVIGTAEAEIISTATSDDEVRNYLFQIGFKLNKFARDNAASSRAFELNALLALDDAHLVDHNDHQILYNWECEERRNEIENAYKEFIDELRHLIKLRFLLIHFLSDSLNIYNQSEKENQQRGTNLSKIQSSIDQLLKSIKTNYNNREKDSTGKINPFHPKSMYLCRLIESGWAEFVNGFVRLGTSLISNSSFLDNEASRTDEPNKTLIEFKSEFEATFAHIRLYLDGQLTIYENSQVASLTSMANLIETLSCSLECVSFGLIIFVTCLNASHVKPIWTERIKKSKKKKDASYLKYLPCIDLFYEIYQQFAQVCAYHILVLRDKLASASVTSKCEALFAQVKPTVESAASNCFAPISSSYTRSLEDMKKCFISKLKILFKLAASGVDMQDYLDSVKSKF